MSRRALAAAIAAAACLRALPLLAPHLGIELGQAYPESAVRAIADHTWKPFSLVHGSLLSDVLRALFTGWYVVGHALGRYPARADLLAEFFREPFPFVVAGRVVVLIASLAGVWLAAWIASRLAGRRAGAAAAAVLATCFIHVRESLHVWPDAVAATAAAATIAMALVHMGRGTRGTAALLGAVAALALASKPAVFPLAVPVALALVWGGDPSTGARVRRVTLATAVAVVVFLVVSPHYVLSFGELLLHMRIQAMGTFASVPVRIAWVELLRITLGVGPIVLATIGIVASLQRAPRTAIVVAAFPIAYLLMLARANPFARYFAVAAPLVAALAGVGAASIAERMAPRRGGLATLGLVALAVVEPAYRSWQYGALIRRPDTRILAGEWLARHVAPGTAVTLPNIVGYANPVVAPDAQTLKLALPEWQPALVARGLGDPARTYRLHYQGILSTYDAAFTPRDPVVVTATHPAASAALSTPEVNAERLRAAGYAVGARFEAIPDPPPPELIYDPLEADYAPLMGAELVPRLGPTLTIWLAPGSVGGPPAR